MTDEATIHKSGTLEELKKDMEQCGFHPDPACSLEAGMAKARMQIDIALAQILQESGLPLFLFDYLVTSVQSDIRKADLDTIRMQSADKTERGKGAE